MQAFPNLLKDSNKMSEVKLSRDDSQKERNASPINLPLAENDWKLECWTELKVKDRFIDKRSYHASVIYNSRLYVYGGQDLNVGIYSDFNYVQLNEDLFLTHWEPVRVKGTQSPGPLARMSSVLIGDKWYLFGGTISATENTSNMWCFDFLKEEWSQIRPSNNVNLPTLDSHSSCHYKDDQDKNYIISFGGFVGGAVGEYWNQILIFDVETKRWKLPYNEEEEGVPVHDSEGPSPRCGHSATIYNDKMYVFGGTNGELRNNDLWIYDLVDKSWEAIKLKDNPPPRNGHTSVVYKNEGLLIFGGIQDITHERDDILYFSFAQKQWKILDNQYDHSKVSSKAPSPDRSPKSNKFDRSFRGKSFMDSPGKKTSIFKESRQSSRNDIGTAGAKRGYSPALSVKGRFSKLPTNNSFVMSHSDMKNTLPFSAKAAARTYQGLTKDNEEKRRKLFLAKKANFLKEFEISDPSEIKELVVKSPTTESMKNSIVAVNYKGHQDFFEAAAANGNSSPSKAKKKPVSFFDNILGADFMKVKIPIQGKLNGHKPCARDGHTALIYGNKMIVFGGDRHKMSFNDLYSLNMKQLISPAEF